MARALRIEFPNAFYHVMSRGVEKRIIYKNHRDKYRFLQILEESVQKHSLHIFAYCLMNNHFHLLLKTPNGNLSNAMHFINSSYVIYFNKKWDRVGHLFSSRYKAILVDKDSYAMGLSRYIHLNPVKANIVPKPELYKWSSYSDYRGFKSTPWLTAEWVLKLFAKDVHEGRKRYKHFTEKVIEQKLIYPLENVSINSEIEELYTANKEELGSHIKPTFQDIRNLTAKDFSNEPKLNRKIAIYLSSLLSGHNLSEIGTEFGGIKKAAVKMIIDRLSKKIEDNNLLKDKILRLKDKLL